MSKLTPTERAFTKRVRDFVSRTNISLSTIGNSDEVHYSNTTKLREFVYEEKGTISMAVQGRIEIYMQKHDKKK